MKEGLVVDLQDMLYLDGKLLAGEWRVPGLYIKQEPKVKIYGNPY